MKKLIIICVLSLLIACDKDDTAVPRKYVIFSSDSTNVFAKRLYDADSSRLYPGIAYEVTDGQTLIFDRVHTSTTNHFKLFIDVGPYPGYHSDNTHYDLVNDYIFVIE